MNTTSTLTYTDHDGARCEVEGCRLISQGCFSNGEQFFMPANGVQQGAIGLGFTSKEGWL